MINLSGVMQIFTSASKMDFDTAGYMLNYDEIAFAMKSMFATIGWMVDLIEKNAATPEVLRGKPRPATNSRTGRLL